MTAFDAVRFGISSVDAVARRLSQAVTAQVAAKEGQPLSVGDIPALMEGVDAEIRRVFGASGAQATRSEAFRAVTDATDFAAETAFRDFFTSLDHEMAEEDPESWRRIRNKVERGGMGPLDVLANAYMSLSGPGARRQRTLRSGLIDPQRRWVSPSGYRLSDRIWRNGQIVRKQIDKTLRHGIEKGVGPATLARDLEQYLNPDLAPVRYMKNGRIVRLRGAGFNGTSGVSATRRLARTEVSRVYHDATRETVKMIDIKGAGVRWVVSNSHPDIDECDDKARKSSRGYPPGVYTPAEFPSLSHPNCLCSAQPWMPSREEVMQQLKDRYGIRDPGFYANRLGFDPSDFEDLFDTPLVPTGGPGFDLEDYLLRVRQENELRARKAMGIVEVQYERFGIQGVWEPGLIERGMALDETEILELGSNVLEALLTRDRYGLPIPDSIMFAQPRDPGTIAWVFRSDRTTIYVNPMSPTWTYVDSIAAIDKTQQDWLFLPSVQGTIDHEMGHLLHFANLDDYGWADKDRYLQGDAGLWWSFDRWRFDEAQRIARGVSEYAATSPTEFVAEVYSGLASDYDFSDEVMGLYYELRGPLPNGDRYLGWLDPTTWGEPEP